MALCGELLAVTALVLVRRIWDWCVADGQLENADRCVLSAVNRANHSSSYTSRTITCLRQETTELSAVKDVKYRSV